MLKIHYYKFKKGGKSLLLQRRNILESILVDQESVCLHMICNKEVRKTVEQMFWISPFKYGNRYGYEYFWSKDHYQWWVKLHPQAKKMDNRMRLYWGFYSLFEKLKDGWTFDWGGDSNRRKQQ